MRRGEGSSDGGKELKEATKVFPSISASVHEHERKIARILFVITIDQRVFYFGGSLISPFYWRLENEIFYLFLFESEKSYRLSEQLGFQANEHVRNSSADFSSGVNTHVSTNQLVSGFLVQRVSRPPLEFTAVALANEADYACHKTTGVR